MWCVYGIGLDFWIGPKGSSCWKNVIKPKLIDLKIEKIIFSNPHKESLQIYIFDVKTKIGVFSKNNHTTIWDASNHDKYVLKLNHNLYIMYNIKK